MTGCGPSGTYFRAEGGGALGGGGRSTADAQTDPGADVASGGTGGTIIGGGSGGTAGGGAPGTGGSGSGGAPGSGGATGGSGTGGGGTGGVFPGTGGAATGGAGTGGAATGGMAVSTGGAGGSGGTGGAGTGGAGTGGMGTGGRGTGGANTGGATPAVRIISIDFVGGSPASGSTVVTPAPAMTATETAGFKPAASWNSAAGPMGMLAMLTLSNTSATTATVSWSSPLTASNPGVWRHVYPDSPGNSRMMDGYLDPTATASPATVTVGMLPTIITSGGYDVYVYVNADIANGSTRTYRYSIGATVINVTQTGPTPGSFSALTMINAAGAGNTIVFRNLTGSSFTLTATPGSSGMRAPVNGMQIVSPTGS